MRASLVLAITLPLLLGLAPKESTGAETLMNGDTNCDGHLDLSDAIFLLAHLYLGAGPPCPLADRPELLARIAELEASVSTLEAALEAKIGELAQAAQRLAAREAELQAAFAAREAELLAALTEREAEVKARADQAASCEAELEEWIENHFSECQGRMDRFIRNSDGTVRDICTDLIWTPALDLNGDGILNIFQGDTRAPYDLADWNSAKDYANGLSFGGFSDWRLPEIEELMQLNGPRWELCFAPAFQFGTCCGQPHIWSATPWNFKPPWDNRTQAWMVSGCFQALTRFPDEQHAILAVRNP